MSWGSNMKRFAITALNLFIAFAGTSAFSADMPVKAPPPPPRAATTWTGFYLGANGGWSGSTSQDSDAFIVPPQAGPNFHQSGGLAGVTYGHNWQFGHSWVLGFEGDFDFADINGSYTNPVFCGTASCFTRLKNFSTDRVRAGVDLNGWLLFATGGLGFGQVNAGLSPCGVVAGTFLGTSPQSSCNETWRAGWVAGAGVEKMIAPHWSAKIEYLHYDFGDTTSSAHAAQYFTASIGGGNWVDVLERGDIVRAG